MAIKHFEERTEVGNPLFSLILTSSSSQSDYTQCYHEISRYHDDVIKWKHFPRYWPFVWGIHRLPASDAEL